MNDAANAAASHPPDDLAARRIGLCEWLCRYHRVGQDLRLMTFNANGTVGLGRAALELRWRLDGDGGRSALHLLGDHGHKCTLTPMDGVWLGRWSIRERIAVELTVMQSDRAIRPWVGRFERKVHSQNGEDGVLEYLTWCVGSEDRFYFEIGTEDGSECNTRLLRERGWRGVMLDSHHSRPDIGLHREFVTREDINDLCLKYNIPHAIDLLSIDVDGNDYWLWEALTACRSRIVIIEYNANLPVSESKVVPYAADWTWQAAGCTKYFGASLAALAKLAKVKGYTLVHANGVNAFFVLDELLNRREDFRLEDIYVHMDLHKPDNHRRQWLTV